MKVKQLEREVDRHKHGANQLMQRNEQLVKEVEGHRQNLHHTGIQMENMKRELGDALVSIFYNGTYITCLHLIFLLCTNHV